MDLWDLETGKPFAAHQFLGMLDIKTLSPHDANRYPEAAEPARRTIRRQLEQNRCQHTAAIVGTASPHHLLKHLPQWEKGAADGSLTMHRQRQWLGVKSDPTDGNVYTGDKGEAKQVRSHRTVFKNHPIAQPACSRCNQVDTGDADRSRTTRRQTTGSFR